MLSENTTGEKYTPICQAEGCERNATMRVESAEGHPDSEWKLCRTHFADADGCDPYFQTSTDWMLRKLYYRDKEGNKISHNIIQSRLVNDS